MTFWIEQLQAIEYEGKWYILNGHNRLADFSELGDAVGDMKVDVRVFNAREGEIIAKDVMNFIKRGEFKTPIKGSN